MRLFEIVDARKRHSAKPCGLLRFDEVKHEFEIEIDPTAGADDVPMLFIPFVERGERTIPHEWALVWVQERIPPPGRQNLAEILIANGLEEYDELTLLLAGDGRCSQDEFMVREVLPVDERALPKDPSTASTFHYAYVDLEPRHSVALKETIATQIASLRKKRHMSQAELADKTGVSQAKICRIERGEANPTLETIALLAHGLGAHFELTLQDDLAGQ